MKNFILFILAVVLAACSFSGNSEFARNHQKWQEANIPHYRFELNIGCFCAFRSRMPLTIEVQNGEIASMTGPDGVAIPTTDSNYEYFSRFATIDHLFSELEADLAGEADEVTVSYEATYGYPIQISIDFIKEAVDDELGLTVSGFEALP